MRATFLDIDVLLDEYKILKDQDLGVYENFEDYMAVLLCLLFVSDDETSYEDLAEYYDLEVDVVKFLIRRAKIQYGI